MRENTSCTFKVVTVPQTPNPLHRHTPDWLILTIACIAQFMVVLDVSIVNVALPHMGLDLGLNQTKAQWVINAYVLTFAGFLLLGGRCADLFGRRRVYLVGVLIFTLASVAAGVSHSATEMIVARAVQGLGGAILSPATLTIIVTTFHGARMPKAIGAWSAVAGAGGAVGGLAGGLLTGLVSWRWIFFINVPFGIIATVAAVMYLQELRNQDASSKLDITGAFLITGGLTALIYGVVNTTTQGWGATSIHEWFALAAVGIIGFVFWEAKVASQPLVAFRIFHSRPLTVANLVMLLAGGAFFSMWFFLTYYFQVILGYGAVRAGFSFLPMAVAIIIGSQVSAHLLGKTGVRPLLLIGSLLATVGFYWLSLITVHSSYWANLLPPSFVASFAMGLLFAPLATAATAKVDRRDAGLASGVLNSSRQIGGSLSLAILGTVAADRTASALHGLTTPSMAATHVAYVEGYVRAFQCAGVVTLVAFFVSLALPAGVGHHSSHGPAVSPETVSGAGH